VRVTAKEVGETWRGLQGVEVGFIGIVGRDDTSDETRARERRGGGHVAVKCWVSVGKSAWTTCANGDCENDHWISLIRNQRYSPSGRFDYDTLLTFLFYSIKYIHPNYYFSSFLNLGLMFPILQIST